MHSLHHTLGYSEGHVRPFEAPFRVTQLYDSGLIAEDPTDCLFAQSTTTPVRTMNLVAQTDEVHGLREFGETDENARGLLVEIDGIAVGEEMQSGGAGPTPTGALAQFTPQRA